MECPLGGTLAAKLEAVYGEVAVEQNPSGETYAKYSTILRVQEKYG